MIKLLKCLKHTHDVTQMRQGDNYVADASTVALQKFLGLLGSALSPPAAAIRTYNSASQL
jgi:hypothetical protein